MFILLSVSSFLFFFFFQAEDGIRDIGVTGVQTCALPILAAHLSSIGTTKGSLSGALRIEKRWCEFYLCAPVFGVFSGFAWFCEPCLQYGKQSGPYPKKVSQHVFVMQTVPAGQYLFPAEQGMPAKQKSFSMQAPTGAR